LSLPSNKSRPICVGDLNYRYIVSRRLSSKEGEFEIVVTVERVGGSQLLRVNGLYTRDFYLDISEGGLQKSDYVIVKPGDVRVMIENALENGWKPCDGNGVFKYDYENCFSDRRKHN
jgi:hypothetical protein